MIRIQEYVKAESLKQAYELNQDRENQIIGGMMWMRQGNREIRTAIDLSGLGLDEIEETENEFVIGAMVSLQKLMDNEAFSAFTDGAVIDALKPIVGVQFRNMATVGGSIAARLGFSDVLTLLMVFDTYVKLYDGGEVPLAEFAEKGLGRDILTHIVIRNDKGSCCYQAVRGAKTDLPILNCAARKTEAGIKMSFGARPGRAVLVENMDIASVKVGSNARGSEEYRRHLVKVLAERSMEKLGGEALED